MSWADVRDWLGLATTAVVAGATTATLVYVKRGHARFQPVAEIDLKRYEWSAPERPSHTIYKGEIVVRNYDTHAITVSGLKVRGQPFIEVTAASHEVEGKGKRHAEPRRFSDISPITFEIGPDDTATRIFYLAVPPGLPTSGSIDLLVRISRKSRTSRVKWIAAESKITD